MVPRNTAPASTRARLGAVLTATAIAAAVATTPASATTAKAGGGTFTLTPQGGNAAALAGLQKALPHASVGQVVGDANRKSTRVSPFIGVTGIDKYENGFSWNAGDNSTTKWFPQGLTGTADAAPGGLVDGRRALLASWYAKNPSGTGTVFPGVRVSFVASEKLASAAYRHVLLVDPYRRKDGGADFRWAKSHAGGIAWVGNRLYVAETNSGLSVYDTSRMMRISATKNKGKVGCLPGPCEAASYQYVMPKVASYGGRTPKLTFSSVAYDRSTNSLVTAEYRKGQGGARVVRWGLNPDGSMAVQKTKAGPRVVSDGTWTTDATNVQSALTRGNTLYLSTSGGDHGLYQGPLGGSLAKRSWPGSGEDLMFSEASGRLYSLTESVNKRAVFAVGG